jgi:hypothetical protein
VIDNDPVVGETGTRVKSDGTVVPALTVTVCEADWYPARLTPTEWGPGVWDVNVYGVTCPVPVLSRVIAAPAGLDVTAIDPVVGIPPTLIVPGTITGVIVPPPIAVIWEMSRLSEVVPAVFPFRVRVARVTSVLPAVTENVAAFILKSVDGTVLFSVNNIPGGKVISVTSAMDGSVNVAFIL